VRRFLVVNPAAAVPLVLVLLGADPDPGPLRTIARTAVVEQGWYRSTRGSAADPGVVPSG
jgi:hypothetical protein